MRKTLVAAVLVLVSVATPFSQSKRAVTFDDVLNVKGVGGATISPDGSQVIYTVRQWVAEKDRMESRAHVWKVATSGSSPARQITFGDKGDSQPQFSPDGRYISFVSARGAGEDVKAQIHVMRADAGEAWQLTDSQENVSSYSWAPDSARIAFVATDPRSADEDANLKKRDDERVFEGDFRYSHVWVVDLEVRLKPDATADSTVRLKPDATPDSTVRLKPDATPEHVASGFSRTNPATRITQGTAYTVAGAPSWAPDSRRFVFGAGATPMLRDNRRDIYLADVTSKRIDKISTNFGSDTSPRWSPDGKSIAWTAEPNTGAPLPDGTAPGVTLQSKLMLYDVAAKSIKDVSSPGFDTDAGNPVWTAEGNRVMFVSGKRAYNEAFAYDLTTGRYTQLSSKKTLQGASISKDGRTIALTMDTPDSASEVYVTDPVFQNFRKLTTTNPQLAELAQGDTEVVTWKGADGMEVEGVLLKPVGFQAGRKYPTLVVAHGGPAGAHVNGFRLGGLEGGQVWANKGWAVFYPNPRGSTNYGEKFLRNNVNDWGGGDFKDIMTGVDALVARGIADPDKLAHIGWSYGGYMTAWVITQTTRFKAAMVGAGLTNMWSMYGTNDIPSVLIGYFGGIPSVKTLPLYLDRSAMSHIDKVTTPTLILHGAQDERVPVGQAQELFRGLKDRGKPTELVFYPREGHGISEYYHQKDRMQRIYDWVTKYTLASTTSSQ